MFNNRELEDYLHDVHEFIKEEGVIIPNEAVMSIYHHKGIDKIRECGATFINVVNKGYCKSYVIMLKGQKYPEHYHKIKEETYFILRGMLHLVIDKRDYILDIGDLIDIERGQDHKFWGERTGVIFEELSTMYMPNDSFYKSAFIRKMSYDERRTIIDREIYKETIKKWE